MKIDKNGENRQKNGENQQKMVQYWFRVLSLKFCGKSKKNCRDISPQSPAFCMYDYRFGQNAQIGKKSIYIALSTFIDQHHFLCIDEKSIFQNV